MVRRLNLKKSDAFNEPVSADEVDHEVNEVLSSNDDVVDEVEGISDELGGSELDS